MASGGLSSRQYEEKINRLEESLQMCRLKAEASGSLIKQLNARVEELEQQVAEGQAERDNLTLRHNSSKLVEDLRDERAQRLQDLENAQKKDREIEALSKETAIVTRGALLAQKEASNRRAEIIALRKTLTCSAKLVNAAEKDYKLTHTELEATRMKLLDSEREKVKQQQEVRLWIARYEQAMVDLHVAQTKLYMNAKGKTQKEAAYTRGYGLVVQQPGTTPLEFKRQGKFHQADAKRKTNLLPTRKHTIASMANAVAGLSKTELAQLKAAKSKGATPTPAVAVSRHSNNYRPSVSHNTIWDEPEEDVSSSIKRIQTKKKGTVRRTEDSMRSKFVGRGLGMLKIDPLT